MMIELEDFGENRLELLGTEDSESIRISFISAGLYSTRFL